MISKCSLPSTEPYTPRQNKAERVIGELRRRWRSRMASKNVPSRLWDFGFVYECEIMSRIARGPDFRPGIEVLTGDTVDISEWLDFEFYDPVWYWHRPGDEDNPRVGRWLGVAHRVGSNLCYWILTASAKVVARTTVQHITEIEMLDPVIKKRVDDADTLSRHQVEARNYFDHEIVGLAQAMDDIELDDELADPVNLPDATEEAFDEYIGAELFIPSGGELIRGRVTKRLKDWQGNPVGTRSANPIFDTRDYEAVLEDGTVQQYSANLIAEYMQSRMDPEGVQHDVFREVVDHRKSTVKDKPDVWSFCVEWADGSTSWLPYMQIRISNPVELATYLQSNRLAHEPPFDTWVPDILAQKERIVVAAKKNKRKYCQTTHKFGFRMPKFVKEALQIDREEGSTPWRDAIEKEMRNVRPAFRKWIVPGGVIGDGTVELARSNRFLVGYQKIKCHMVFDIEVENLVRKARFVAGGHTTETPASMTYSSVVARNSVRIAFLLASVEGLEVWAADVGNAYLNAKCREKIWTVAGPEFGEDEGKVMLIEKALYGLKTSGAAWRAMLAGTMSDMGFESSRADPDVWIRPNAKANGERYYERVLIYVDDILCVSHDPRAVMEVLRKTYRLKDESVGPPTRYLGADIKQVLLESGDTAWMMCRQTYVQTAIANLQKQLAEDGFGALRGRAPRPFRHEYRPEVDGTDLLSPAGVTYYQGLIGILRWMCELGRLDILTETALMSSYNARPRHGHLAAVLDIFAYLKRFPQGGIVLDPGQPRYDRSGFIDYDWTDIYGAMSEELPPRMPEPLGAPLTMSCFVDADHAENLVTRRSHTGIVIFLSQAPVVWYSKRQNSVETSTFGSEFVALRIAVELIQALGYKLRMFGVPVVDATDVFCDNQAVVFNSSIPQSMLAKKHNAICFHRVREAVASGMIRVAKVQSEFDLADGFTKSLPAPRRQFIFSRLMMNPQWNEATDGSLGVIEDDSREEDEAEVGLPADEDSSD
jgi:Reverse transcriptase (RNA-dependent DNA polymerase)